MCSQICLEIIIKTLYDIHNKICVKTVFHDGSDRNCFYASGEIAPGDLACCNRPPSTLHRHINLNYLCIQASDGRQTSSP
jgi:hypothetical protein